MHRHRLITSLVILASAALATVGGARARAEEAGKRSDFLVMASQHSLLGPVVAKEMVDNADVIDVVAPMWFGAADDGAIAPLPQFAPAGGSAETFLARARELKIKVMPLIRNFAPQSLLANPAAIDRCVEELDKLCADLKLDGLVIDFEHLKAPSREPLVGFLAKLHAKTQARGITLAVAVQPHAWEKEYDYKGISDNVDLVYVMFYDYTGPWKKVDGPTAPLHWPGNPRDIARDLDNLLAAGVEPGKLLMGLPTYGGDFALDAAGKTTDVKVEYIDPLRARLKTTGGPEQWDDVRKAAFVEYTDEQGTAHRAWFDTTASFQARLDLARSKNLRGVALWAIRYPDRPTATDLWTLLRQQP